MKIRNFLFSFTGQSLLLYNGLFLPGEIVQNLAITYCSLRFMVFFLLLICIIFLVNNLSQSDENKATIEEITQLSLNRVPLSNFLKSMSYVVAFVYYSKGLFSLAITITITCLIELLISYIVNRLSKLWVDDVLQNEGL